MDLQYDVSERTTPKFVTALAASDTEVEEAQRLRYRVFAEEHKARLAGDGSAIDRDGFDPYCDHLIVRARDTGCIVGTYRILGGQQADLAGGFYTETEFDLPLLRTLRPRVVELGRACVAPEYRKGAVIRRLWSALARYITTHPYDFVIGCGSISLASGAHVAASVCHRLTQAHLSPPQWRARPLHPFPTRDFIQNLDVAVPPLIAGYLQLGAQVCGEPAWDPNFNTADVLLWLPVREINTRYLNRLLRAA
jgi:putative hemolysin